MIHPQLAPVPRVAVDMDIHGYIHGYCTMHSAEMYARQRSFSASSWPIVAASSKNVVQKAIKLFVRHEQQYLDTCERCQKVRRTASHQMSTVE